MKDIGPLLGADEGLNHQIVDTFATLSQTDMAWTEKIWASIAKTDGSLQLDFGLGKYQNRGIIDGFGGVSRGREQWTVRGSRELASAPASGRNVLRDSHIRCRGAVGVQLGLPQRRERCADTRAQRAPPHQLRQSHALREARRTAAHLRIG
jgi:hypothetical protein